MSPLTFVCGGGGGCLTGNGVLTPAGSAPAEPAADITELTEPFMGKVVQVGHAPLTLLQH